MHRQLRPATVLLVALVLMTSSMTHVTCYPRYSRFIGRDGESLGPRNDRDIVDGPSKPNIHRPSARLILLILRQRCQRLIDQGSTDLPTYCFSLFGIQGPSAAVLYSSYDVYAQSVPRDQLLQAETDARRVSTTNMAYRLRANA